jgi:uncharacterized membrane protein
MTDDFMRDAQAAWRHTPADIPAMRQVMRKRRWTPHMVLAIEVIAGVFGFAMGLVFFALALETRAIPFILAAIVMLAGMPLATGASIRARRDSLRWEDDTPRGVVVTAARRAEAALRAVTLGRLAVAIIATFVALLWLVQWAGAMHEARFLHIYTAICVVICAPLLVYLHYRERRMRGEQAACLGLLRELDRAAPSPKPTP